LRTRGTAIITVSILAQPYDKKSFIIFKYNAILRLSYVVFDKFELLFFQNRAATCWRCDGQNTCFLLEI